MAVIKFPFTSLQQLNLDWIMQQLHKILDFMPLNGVAGDVLQRTVDGAAWQPLGAIGLDIHGLNSTTPDAADEIPIYDNDLAGNYKITIQDVLDLVPAAAVSSVNGQTGTVVLDAVDVNALPDSTVIPSMTSELYNDSGFVDAAGAAAAAPVQSVNGMTGNVIVSGGGGAVDSVNGQTGTVVLNKTDIGLGNVANVLQYSASNPPPYPVTSVNGQTGAVTIASGSGLDFGTEQTLTLTVPAGITLVSATLKGRITTDNKFISIYGLVRFMEDQDDNGWHNIPLSGISVSPAPASNLTFSCVGIEQHMYNADYAVVDMDSTHIENPAIVVDTTGTVYLRLFIKYGTGIQDWKLFPVILPL